MHKGKQAFNERIIRIVLNTNNITSYIKADNINICFPSKQKASLRARGRGMNHYSEPQLMQNRGRNKRSSLSIRQNNNIRVIFPDKNPKTANCRGLGQTSTILG
jgi:hypothetical protein